MAGRFGGQCEMVEPGLGRLSASVFTARPVLAKHARIIA